MKEKMKIRNALGRLPVFAICSLMAGCAVTTDYAPPAGVPTANIRFRELNVGGFHLYQPPALPACYVPSDPKGGDPIGFADVPPANDSTIILIPSHRKQPRLGMPIDGTYIDRSYFELRMQANHMLTLRVSSPGYDQFDTAFRFTPREGENYEVTVNFSIPFEVHVYRIDSHDGHYSEEPVKDAEIIRRCS